MLRLLIILGVFIAILSLACGKKGPPIPLESRNPDFQNDEKTKGLELPSDSGERLFKLYSEQEMKQDPIDEPEAGPPSDVPEEFQHLYEPAEGQTDDDEKSNNDSDGKETD